MSDPRHTLIERIKGFDFEGLGTELDELTRPIELTRITLNRKLDATRDARAIVEDVLGYPETYLGDFLGAIPNHADPMGVAVFKEHLFYGLLGVAIDYRKDLERKIEQRKGLPYDAFTNGSGD